MNQYISFNFLNLKGGVEMFKMNKLLKKINYEKNIREIKL